MPAENWALVSPYFEISFGVSGRWTTWPFNASVAVAALTVATAPTNANATAARPTNIFHGRLCVFISFEFCLGLRPLPSVSFFVIPQLRFRSYRRLAQG